MYTRSLEKQVKQNFFCGKILMILGPRQVGKTTFIKKILSEYLPESVVSFNGDDLLDRENLSINSLKKLELFVEGKDIVFIDEAQKIQNIGDTLKLLIDHYGDKKQIIVTGSSSIHLLDYTHEPLTGRKIVYYMYPISATEIRDSDGIQMLDAQIDMLLLYGSYPQSLNMPNREQKIEVLRELSGATLYRDILEFQSIKNSSVLIKLLKLLALQIGKEVSMNELATQLSIDAKTVDSYIDLLEKSFLVFRLPPYFTNKRKELSKAHKIYFWDLGIRNVLVNDFNILGNRRDTGDLWENFLMIERKKSLSYNGLYRGMYFGRTYSQQEIDYIEEYDHHLFAYEYKWSEKKNAVMPKYFREAYPEMYFSLIHRGNYLGFVFGNDDF